MVIDKSTGRGCALSMTAKVITGKLIAEGIEGKIIHSKRRANSKTSYDLFRVKKLNLDGNEYVVSKKCDEPVEEPPWLPSFIDEEIWKQAVSRFPDYKRLDQSVEKYLLPEMGEYLKGFSDADLASLIKDFLIERGVINSPICQHGGKTYYFNRNEVYPIHKKSELFPYEGRVKFNIFKIKDETCFNMNVWSKAVSRFETGMTLKECIIIFLQTDLAHNVPHEQAPIDRLVQYIAPPIYERIPENDNKSTFDYIRITVGLPRYQLNSWETLQEEVEKHKMDIFYRVVKKLEQDRQFKKYGVPTEFLKLSDVTLLHDFSIEFIFELKEPEYPQR